ncbi:MAG: hypothetical protein V9G24_09775 [Rhodoblastus sp.]
MRRRIALQSLVSTLGFGALFAALALTGDNAFLGAARWFFAAAALLPALVMTWRAAAAYLLLVAALAGVVTFLNDGKIALTEMPLTWLDLQIAASNPAGFLGAVKVSPTLAYAIAAGARCRACSPRSRGASLASTARGPAPMRRRGRRPCCWPARSPGPRSRNSPSGWKRPCRGTTMPRSPTCPTGSS